MAVTSFKTSSMTTGSKRARVWDQSSSPGNFESIATNTVTAATINEVVFSNIPQTYTHLQLRFTARCNLAASTDNNAEMYFNSDTTSNYSQHGMYSNNLSATGTFANVNMNHLLAGRTTAASSTSGVFGVGIIDILDYTNTNKFKTIRSLTGHDQNGSGFLFLFSGNWRSTAAITSIRFIPANSAAWVQNSNFSLYGVI